jgi:hypothetical protein
VFGGSGWMGWRGRFYDLMMSFLMRMIFLSPSQRRSGRSYGEDTTLDIQL